MELIEEKTRLSGLWSPVTQTRTPSSEPKNLVSWRYVLRGKKYWGWRIGGETCTAFHNSALDDFDCREVVRTPREVEEARVLWVAKVVWPLVLPYIIVRSMPRKEGYIIDSIYTYIYNDIHTYTWVSYLMIRKSRYIMLCTWLNAV